MPANNLPLFNENNSCVKGKITPMMEQYLEIKNRHKDSILFYRLGDFYEMFFDDAVIAAKELDIALTRRGKQNGSDIPMCGVPFHAYENYLSKLISKGYRVAICEQTELNTKSRKASSGPLKRDVVRVVTPGTLYEESLLDNKNGNYLMAFSPIVKGHLGMSILDSSTGKMFCELIKKEDIQNEISRFTPSEIIIPEYIRNICSEIFTHEKKRLVVWPNARFDYSNAKDRLLLQFNVQTLDGFGDFSNVEVCAASAIIDYAYLCQKSDSLRILPPKKIDKDHYLQIDMQSRKSLEIETRLDGSKDHTLLSVIDRTRCAMGARLLRFFIRSPLKNTEEINKRYNEVSKYIENETLRINIQKTLETCPDFERALTRVMMKKSGPRDLGLILRGLKSSRKIMNENSNEYSKKLEELEIFLDRSLCEELPYLARDGGFIRIGFDESLDEIKDIRDNAGERIRSLQEHYITETGITSLKIKSNNVLGYFIDIPPKHIKKVPYDFTHRQTIASSIRYNTQALSELEHKIIEASHQALQKELEIFDKIQNYICEFEEQITKTCDDIAHIDVFTSFSELASLKNYVRPEVNNSIDFEIIDGKHPVLGYFEENFIPNNCSFSSETLLLLTGPNMAGKSTYLRQNALIALMAQIGSFVPAKKAKIGIVDQIFTRIGASDDLTNNRSTFMVEMVETAAILNQATEKSMVILDEVGRGTATNDGLAIAQSVLEHLISKIKCRSLFATHYHELTKLSEDSNLIKCLTLDIREHNEKITFLHKIIDGIANKSYGVHVASLAGLPESVIKRSESLLNLFDKNSKKHIEMDENITDIKYHDNNEKEKNYDNEKEMAAIHMINSISPDSLSPREALDMIYAIKYVLNSENK